jgi:CheY-like chemotaxis protein
MKRPVLYVEDEENDVFFMQRAFDQAGLRNPLLTVENGREAIHYLQGKGDYHDRSKHPLPFMILLDLKLPYLPGLDVLKWIRDQPELKTMLVVVLTSSSEDEDINLAYKLGANSFLVKPPTANKLLEMVKSLGDYWFNKNEPPRHLPA